jgi:VWFA-related protein
MTCLAILAAAGALPAAQSGSSASPGALRILSPLSTEPLNGTTTFAAEVAPATLQVSGVAIFVDGERICQLEARPFTCSWDAGHVSRPRSVRVVADLAGGERLVRTLRTAPAPVFLSSSVEAVLVPVHVTDRGDRFVSGLDASHFRVLEDDVPQDISALLVEDVPINLLLALDVSGSMTPAIGQLRSAAEGFLDALRPQDRVSLAAFNSGVYLLSPPGAPLTDSRVALRGLRPTDGTTAIYDTIVRAVDLIKGQPSPRAIVIFTDGEDDASHANADAMRTALQTHNVALYVIAQGRAAKDETLRKQLSSLAAETGGAAWFAARMDALQQHFAEVVRDLTGQYVLAYSPKRPVGDGAWRKISVEVVNTPRKYDVRAREGYLAVADR